MAEFSHTPVMLAEVLENLAVKPDGLYVDGTLGGAGHAFHVCERLGETGRFLGMDRDGDAIEAATKRLAPFGEKVTIVRANYGDYPSVLQELGLPRPSGILLDLGVSSWQLDTASRGFTYREDAPLDMRMDVRQSLTAWDVINTYSQQQLTDIFKKYGEERFAANIAKRIVERRSVETVNTTGQLCDIIRRAIPVKMQAAGGHPAKRVFQAVRIEVNGELDVLEHTLDAMIESLAPGGRLCVITFHSLEDRIVKNHFRENANPCICPPNFPVCTCGRVSKGRVVTGKPILPTEEETRDNPRAKSAKLRVFERTPEA
ncbi:MAG: 16S rRNA (cytosine(1402)-N(4))-methyltransferase RsmH [Lachnospiraceae bacterium]|nr:16S rRNA (cytosine(1402)-N(4))-methyltransferase RsmH [Lachnospiraceae bacterium]